MLTRATYSPGVPCWIDTLQADLPAALDFYAGLFGWEMSGPGPMPGAGAEYFVARVGEHDVAGIAALPNGSVAPPAWTTYVRVNDVAEATARAERGGGAIVVAPFDALPAGRSAILTCPDGAVFGLWEAHEREGAQRVNAPNTWAMSSLVTHGVERAKAFYGMLFGWTTQPLDAGDGPITLFRLPGYVGGTAGQPVPRDVVAYMTSSGRSLPPHWNVDFRVADVDAAAERAESLGGRVVVPPYDASIFRQAVITDRAGAALAISQLIGSAAKP